MTMAETIGLPHPPAVGETALKDGTYDGVCVFVTGGGTGLGKAIASEFARLGASLVIASRKDEHLDAARAAMDELGAPNLAVACDIREPDSIAAAEWMKPGPPVHAYDAPMLTIDPGVPAARCRRPNSRQQK